MKIAMRMHGDAATALRQLVARAPKADLERSLRQSLSGTMSWIDVDRIDWRDDAAHDGLELNRASTIKNGVASFLVESRSVTQEISAAEAEAATKMLRRLAGEDSLMRAPG